MAHDASSLSPDSWVVSGGRPDGGGSPLNVPIELASNFRYGSDGAGRSYSRDHGTANWVAFEEVIGGLEGVAR
ncbi:MAG: hypothetical protein R3F34_19090 [Planctomycetota bacterium]